MLNKNNFNDEYDDPQLKTWPNFKNEARNFATNCAENSDYLTSPSFKKFCNQLHATANQLPITLPLKLSNSSAELYKNPTTANYVQQAKAPSNGSTIACGQASRRLKTVECRTTGAADRFDGAGLEVGKGRGGVKSPVA